ncbi:MAG: hypothetical protein LQ348_001178 [Seirophora lacunosa]|nr:MAG: hypothetical protein LQ348_001178 [Seirophora lacunosa]
MRWSSVSQRPGSDHVHFPGAVDSKFTTKLSFERPSTHPAIPTYRFMDSDGVVVDEGRDPGVTDEEVLTWYKNMLTGPLELLHGKRDLFSIGVGINFVGAKVSAGEEGIAVGSASALSPEDVIFAQYRETGVFQQRGFTLEDFMSQLFANRKDVGKGRNMPVHYGSSKLNIHTISSPLATQIPQAAGAAYALKLQALQNPNLGRRIVACYFGEGAASEGDFHAALNIAATRACPAVFVCRNNGYAISTPTLEQYRGDGIASRGVGYGIDTVRVDGNDIFAVREATKLARGMALEQGGGGGGGGKPVLVEAMSYRVSHHSTSDDSFAYRARVEVEDWKRRDNPITRLRKWMERKGLWDEAREREARSAIRKDVLRAFAAAEKELKPPLRSMFEDVYAEVTPEVGGQMEGLRDVLERYPDEYDVGEFEGGRESLR